MNPERWSRINELFEGALQHEGAARATYLDQSCAEDPTLRREVESLLEADGRAEGFTDGLAAELGLRAGDPDGGWIGRRIGVYRIVERIGEGGMSTVYLARRDDEEFEDRVAIKVLRGGPQNPYALERFELERQILADLSHPGIARLRDGGTLPEGLPYVVMDYVDGVPIDQFCDREDLDVEARLELFLRVCEAVQAAHQSLVVHRDLKPANILVSPDGQPRLLDFGIAKPLDPDTAPEVTRTWLRAMTPRYASPEQVVGGPITTATDVYGLGVILYELLAGSPPYDLRGLTPTGWQKAVVEQEPPRPSDAAATAARRRRLRGDLDTIVLTALHKKAQRRYGTVDALADDIRRHLEALPVRARPDTYWYRVRKLLWRNRIISSLVGVLVLLSLSFGTFATLQAARVERERNKAEQALGFLVDLFKMSDPARAPRPERADEITAREILDVGARRVSTEFDGQPELQARLEQAIGEVYLSLGLYDQATPLLRRAAESNAVHLGPRHPQTLAARFHEGRADVALADWPSAEAILREVLTSRTEVLGAEHPATLETRIELAQALEWQDRLPEVVELLDEGIRIGRGKPRSGEPLLSQLLGALARVRQLEGAFAEAEKLFLESLEIQRRAFGPGSYREAELLNNLGVVTHDLGRPREALALLRESQALWTPLLEKDHPYLMASRLTASVILRDLGRYDEAERELRHILAVREKRFDPLHRKVLVTIYQLGGVAAAKGDWAAAEELFRETVDRASLAFGEDGRYTATARNDLGACLRQLGRLDEAEEEQRRSLEALQALLGDEHPVTTRPVLELGRIALARGDLERAQELVTHALEVRKRLHPPGHPKIVEAEEVMAQLSAARGSAR